MCSKKVQSIVERVKYFCATQKGSFYAGMVFTVFSLIALTTHLSIAVSAILCPFITMGLYFIARLTSSTPNQLLCGEIKDGLIASVLGCAWVLLFVVI